MWLLAVGCGMVVGKIIIHGIILSRFLRLKMFRADQVIFLIKIFFTGTIRKFLFPFFIFVIGLVDGAISYRDHFSVPIFQCLQCASNYDLSKIQ